MSGFYAQAYGVTDVYDSSDGLYTPETAYVVYNTTTGFADGSIAGGPYTVAAPSNSVANLATGETAAEAEVTGTLVSTNPNYYLPPAEANGTAAELEDTITYGTVPAGSFATLYLASSTTLSTQFAEVSETLSVSSSAFPGPDETYSTSQIASTLTGSVGETTTVQQPDGTVTVTHDAWSTFISITFPVVSDGVYTVTQSVGAQAGDPAGNYPLGTSVGAVAGTTAIIDPNWALQSTAPYTTASGDQLPTPCCLAGTLIATPRGEVPVERLAVGDLVHAQDAGAALIKWIGHRRVDCFRHPKPQKVWPVRVCAGAFGEGLPLRDLWLSPDHAVFVGEVLIPIKHLINGISIEQVPMDEVTYYHVELEHHDVLFAEGLPAESYLDTGDRFNFENGGGPISLHPEFSARRWETARIWEALGCARLIVTGPELDAVRQRVNYGAATLAAATTGNRAEVRAASDAV
jgi:hypothetical protein